MSTIKSYLQFYRRATNLHGIHSPFIYSLLEDTIYPKNKLKTNSPIKSRKKEYQLYFKLLLHFKPQKIYLYNDDEFFIHLLNDYKKHQGKFSISHSTPKDFHLQDIDLFILNNDPITPNLIKSFENSEINNDSFVIIPEIRASKHQQNIWSHIIQEPFSRICLEFYTFGLVFFRKENTKEYFKIRF